LSKKIPHTLMVTMNKKSTLSLVVLISLISLSLSGCLQTPDSSSPVAFGIGLDNATALQQVATYGEGQAQEITLSPDGHWMAVRSTTGTHLYDTQTWETLDFDGSRQVVSQMAFSPAGDLLALTIPATNEIELWQLPEAKLLYKIAIPGGYYSTMLGLSFTPNGDRLISTSFQTVNIWRVSDGGLIGSFESPEGASFKNTSLTGDASLLSAVLVGNAINGVMAWRLEDQGLIAEYNVSEGDRLDYGQFAPTGGQFAALASQARELFVWGSLEDPQALEIKSPEFIVNFAWVPVAEGNMLATGHSNGDITFWDSVSGEQLNTLPSPVGEFVELVQFDPVNDWLVAVYGNGSVGLWSLPDGRLEWIVETVARELPRQISIHADGTKLFILLPSGRIRTLDMQTGREMKMLATLTTGQVLDLAFSPDGKWIAAGLDNGLASVWQFEAGENSKVLLDQGVRIDSIAFSPDTMRLATGVGGFVGEFAYDDTVQVWDWGNASILERFAGEQEVVPGCSVFRNQVAFSPDGSRLASISHDFSLSIWDTKGQALWKSLTGHTQPVLDMVISNDGTMLASASLDGSIRLWQTQQGTVERVLEGDPIGMLAVALSPDGSLVVGASTVGVISVWDAESGRLLRTLEGTMNNSSKLAFSVDGSLIAAGSGDGLNLWSSQTGELVTSLPGEGGNIISVTFSNDGSLLAYGSDMGFIHLWKSP
jgi:WD40 repeat protein